MERNARWRWVAVAAAGACLATFGGWFAVSGAAPEATGKAAAKKSGAASKRAVVERIVKTDEQWMKQLTPEQYRILRQKGTERAFTGKYWDHHQRGVYVCAACGLELFDADTKFDSGTGWPSYWKPIAPGHVEEHRDLTLGMVRVEAVCARCGGHLGHVFDDGPKPTGLRYCINSASLGFEPRK